MFNLIIWALASTSIANTTYPPIMYPPLYGLAISDYHHKIIEITYLKNKYIVELDYFSQNENGKFYNFEYIFINSSLHVFDFAKSQGAANFVECTPKIKLEVYNLDWSTLNDKFSGIYQPENLGRNGIQGLYDPRIDQRGTASLAFTSFDRLDLERSQEEKLALIGHEVAHYWFDRLCLNYDWYQGAEAFAVKFEDYYLGKVEK